MIPSSIYLVLIVFRKIIRHISLSSSLPLFLSRARRTNFPEISRASDKVTAYNVNNSGMRREKTATSRGVIQRPLSCPPRNILYPAKWIYILGIYCVLKLDITIIKLMYHDFSFSICVFSFCVFSLSFLSHFLSIRVILFYRNFHG